MSLFVRDALLVLDQIAPPHLALDDDPRGLLVGDPNAPLAGGITVALDVTTTVVQVARAQNAGLIVAHHPLIYNPLKRLRADEPHPGSVVLTCAAAGIAVACAHTNWDVAPGGVNDVLADLLGLSAVRPLQITYREPLVCVAVFVPPDHRERVMDAMAEAGAGAIGDYDRCGFWAAGTGTFRPLPGAAPFAGRVGEAETVAEERLEMIVPASQQATVVAAMKEAHPYEEVAHFVFPLANTHNEYGIGRIGTLSPPVPAHHFHQQVKDALTFPEVRMLAPDPEQPIQTVAVCGGAGAFLVSDALRAGADALVTSDVRHHEFVDAEARGIVLLDAGHAQTETPGARELARRLEAALSGVEVRFVG
jgi:dinuclear metal center YbgI/SA1388 family protein